MVDDFTPPRPTDRSMRPFVKSVNLIRPDQIGNVNLDLSDLGDVDGSPGDGDTIIYNSVTNVFEFGPPVHLSQIDQFDVTDEVTDTFTLSHVPIEDSWNVTVNGVTATDGDDYTITDGIVTVTDPADLFRGADGDTWMLQVQYDHTGVVPTNPLPDFLVWYQPGDWTVTGHIEQWNDSTGNAYHGLGSVSYGPTVGAATPGGEPSADFDGGLTQTLLLPLGMLTPLASGGELFLVLKADASGTAGPHQIGSDADCYPSYGNTSVADEWASTTKHTFNPATAIPGVLVTDWHIYSTRSVPGGWKAFIDGVQVHTTATNTVGFSGGTRAIGPAACPSFSTLYWSGNVAELIITVPLTDLERAAVVAYLQARHGL